MTRLIPCCQSAPACVMFPDNRDPNKALDCFILQKQPSCVVSSLEDGRGLQGGLRVSFTKSREEGEGLTFGGYKFREAANAAGHRGKGPVLAAIYLLQC